MGAARLQGLKPLTQHNTDSEHERRNEAGILAGEKEMDELLEGDPDKQTYGFRLRRRKYAYEDSRYCIHTF